MRRANGSWNPTHGSWYGKAEVPAGPDGKRIYLRAGGFASAAELDAFYERAGRLLDIPDAGTEGHEARMEILAMIRAAHRRELPMPDYEELHRKFRAGQPLQAMTFGDYWATWRARRGRLQDIRESTLISYTSHYETHIREVLEKVRLDRLFVPTIEAVFTRIDEKNAALLAARASEDPGIRAATRGKRITGPVTKQRIRATIRTVLAAAEREHLVEFNAAALVKLDSGQRAKGVVWTRPRVEAFAAAFRERLEAERTASVRPAKPLEKFRVWLATTRPSRVMVWTPVQLGTFLDAIATERLYALYHLVAFRGLRRGEACGARWVDADLDEGLLTTARQLTTVGKVVKEGAPKTELSDAAVALDSVTVSVLRAYRAQQLEERLAWGEAWTDTGRIFTREDGRELSPDWVSEHFERLAFAAGLPPIRLHDLRHGAATLSLAAGNDMKTTSAMLRHSSVRITSDIYTNVLPEVARAAAEASVSLVPRAVPVGEGSETAGLPSVSHLPQGRPTDSDGDTKPQAVGLNVGRAGGT
ncbi:site-specific integrase [Spongiactinospora sp. TRM90649]|uniref:tyrosine-type recombinase/integrase n=1 Tax=Spongiactinospora sp. TRM90649 TaxID=3031114 RepID=UPI0023F90465|nr:site-specific integrase [Spongiactinospora sp. TRM90649]MDF5755781.1 site-specific integrase [Spongiactinospora sp. TRM90649]